MYWIGIVIIALIKWHMFHHMVWLMEETVNVDRQGRLVVPAYLRETLGIKEGGKVTLRLDGKKLILEPIDEDVESKFMEWKAESMSQSTPMNVEEPRESWKWMSREYTRKKLGLQ